MKYLSFITLERNVYYMQLQQQEKPLEQQLQTILWQNGGIRINPPSENLPEILNDPQALVWLDIQGDCTP
jgi:hypothetical protein